MRTSTLALRPCVQCSVEFVGVRCKPCTYRKNRAYRQRRRDDLPSSKHGLTPREARALAESQDNRCAACGRLPSGRGHHIVLHIDHCHTTGEIRGALCSNCNLALGLLKDDPTRLRDLCNYLETKN